ncbi:MAG: hypothetical protein ACK5QC_07665 [Bacteroidota bacterium]
MVRGRAVGFIKGGVAEALEATKTLAHELAHGAFGLEHTFPQLAQNSSNNLLDDGSGTHLVKKQWMQIQNPGVIFNWLDTEEDGELQQNNCTQALANTKYTQLQQKYAEANLEGGWSSTTDLMGIFKRGDLLNEINNTCMLTVFKIPVSQRKTIINYLIDNGLNTQINANTFNSLIYLCSDAVFDSLLTYFSANNYAILKSVITSASGDAYRSIMKKLAQKLTANPNGPSTGARLLNLFSDTDYDKRVLGMGSNGKPFIKVGNVDFLNNGKIEVTLEQLDWTFNFTGVLSNPMGGFSYVNFGSYNDYDDISPKILLNPFDLVVYTDFTNIRSVAADGVVTKNEQVIVPAIYLKYIDDKQFEHNVTTVSMVALDMFIIGTSGGLALASKASWLRRAWAAVEVAGAAGNIVVNTGDLGADPDLEAVVQKYNYLQLLLGIKNLGKMTFAKAMSGTKIAASLENIKTAARNDFIALAFKYNTKLTALGNSPKAKVIIDARDRIVKLFNITEQEVNAMKAGTYVYGASCVYGKNNISGINGFSDNINSLVSQRGLSLNDFKLLQQKRYEIGLMTSIEKSHIDAIRDAIPIPNGSTILQKVIPKDDIIKYTSGQYTQIGGFVTTAKDAKHLNSFDDIYYGMRLDYTTSSGIQPFKLSDGSCGVIRYQTPNPNLTVPKLPNETGALPYTGNGFTGGNNGRLGVPEWKSPYNTPNEGAELWEVFSDGSEILKAKFSSIQNKFIPIQ